MSSLNPTLAQMLVLGTQNAADIYKRSTNLAVALALEKCTGNTFHSFFLGGGTGSSLFFLFL
jgi:hypothetical protein